MSIKRVIGSELNKLMELGILQYACFLQRKFESYAERGVSFDLIKEMSLCTLDILLQCIFSMETNCQERFLFDLFNWCNFIPVKHECSLGMAWLIS